MNSNEAAGPQPAGNDSQWMKEAAGVSKHNLTAFKYCWKEKKKKKACARRYKTDQRMQLVRVILHISNISLCVCLCNVCTSAHIYR